MRDNYVTIAVPNTGRTAVQALKWLANAGFVDKGWQVKVARALEEERKSESEESTWNSLTKLRAEGIDGLAMKYDLRSGWRVNLTAKETAIDGVPVIIYGSEAPTTNVIMQSLGAVAIIGFDDLVATLVPYFREGTMITDWNSAINDALKPNATDVRYFFPTGINDYACLFLIACREFLAQKPVQSEEIIAEIRKGEIPVSVKGRYEGLAYYLLGPDSDVRVKEDIEESVRQGYVGLDIVQSGSTVAENDFFIIGKPLLKTTSVITYDQGVYNRGMSGKPTRDVITSLGRISGFWQENYELETSRKVGNWESSLEQKLAGRWLR